MSSREKHDRTEGAFQFNSYMMYSDMKIARHCLDMQVALWLTEL